MQAVIDFFSYINGLGASVMMPIILTIFGVILGAKFGKALRGGLTDRKSTRLNSSHRGSSRMPSSA